MPVKIYNANVNNDELGLKHIYYIVILIILYTNNIIIKF